MKTSTRRTKTKTTTEEKRSKFMKQRITFVINEFIQAGNRQNNSKFKTKSTSQQHNNA